MSATFYPFVSCTYHTNIIQISTKYHTKCQTNDSGRPDVSKFLYFCLNSCLFNNASCVLFLSLSTCFLKESSTKYFFCEGSQLWRYWLLDRAWAYTCLWWPRPQVSQNKLVDFICWRCLGYFVDICMIFVWYVYELRQRDRKLLTSGLPESKKGGWRIPSGSSMSFITAFGWYLYHIFLMFSSYLFDIFLNFFLYLDDISMIFEAGKGWHSSLHPLDVEILYLSI